MSLAKLRDRARRRIRQLKGMRTHEVALAKAGLGPVAGVDAVSYTHLTLPTILLV